MAITETVDAEFDQWLAEVDEVCWQEFGCSIHDLPDAYFWSGFYCFDFTPAEMVSVAEEYL